MFGAIISYVEQFFETVGISLANRQVRPSLSVLRSKAACMGTAFGKCSQKGDWSLAYLLEVHSNC